MARTNDPWMPRPVAFPPARLVRLGDRDHEKWPAMGLEGSPDDRLAVAKPRLMDEWTPAPTTVTPLAMNVLSAACTQLSIGSNPRRPDLSDQFFRAPEGRPLFVRIVRNDPLLPPDPSSGVEREETKLSRGFSPGTHARPAVSSGVQRSAGSSEAGRAAGSLPNGGSSGSSPNTGSNPVCASMKKPRKKRLSHKPR